MIWRGFSIEHVISRSVRDSAAMLDATAGADAGAPYAAPARVRPYRETWRGFFLARDGQRAPSDLGTIVRTTVGLVSHKLKLLNVEAELRLDDSLPPLPCDVSQMQQVVLNLVMNGAEATRPHGSGRVSVTTRRSDDGESAVLEVADDGEGIPKDVVDRIFDPFFTTKEDGKGVGLGLAVVYGIVESHGGRIEVRTGEGRGTTFEVTLPLASEGSLATAGGSADAAAGS